MIEDDDPPGGAEHRPEELEQMRAELRKELREELSTDLRAELAKQLKELRVELVPKIERKVRRRIWRHRWLLRLLVIFVLAGLAYGAWRHFGTDRIAGLAENAAEKSCLQVNVAVLRSRDLGTTSFLFAANGTPLGAVPADIHREPVAAEKISPLLAQATVAIEDRRFFEHDGIDYKGTLRAFLHNVQQGQTAEGGSTITQQLARTLYPIGTQQTIERKLEETCLAFALEDYWRDRLGSKAKAKEQILTLYLNNVYFGEHAYGVEAAAWTYFDKPASRLSLSEAATLAGLIQAPSLYDPLHDRDAARARRDVVLRALFQAGQLDRDRYQRTLQKKLVVHPTRRYSRLRDPYVFDYAVSQLIDLYGQRRAELGGLRVRTTVRLPFEAAAVRAAKGILDRPGDPAAAIVAVDPRSGAIWALTAVQHGRQDPTDFNLAVQGRRQTGSSFKPFVLAEAVRKGMNPKRTFFVSKPLRVKLPDGGGIWHVETYEKSYYGRSSLFDATLRSDNTVYAQLTLKVGVERVVRLARAMGIRSSPLQAVPSAGLGSNSVSPLEMASAYATFAADGVYRAPYLLERVTLPSGEDLKLSRPAPRRVLPRRVVSVVTDVLAANVRAGTGTRAQYGGPAAGKTGTTDDYGDAWFCGYRPGLAAVVWVGYPKVRVPMRAVHGIEVAGGTFPAEIWGRFLGRVSGSLG